MATTSCATLDPMSGQSIKPIAISASVPMATVGSSYHASVSVSGGTAPYAFAAKAGKVPPGLSISPTFGSISGTPRLAGSYSFMLTVADNSGDAQGLKIISITVRRSRVASPPVKVVVSPASANISSGSSKQFAAVVSNADDSEVAWSASAGTVTANGLFTAPKVSSTTSIRLTATSKVNPTKQGSATISVNPPAEPTGSSSGLAMASSSLPTGTEGTPYTATLHASGGKTPYQWKIASGSLPSGFELEAPSGSISGLTSQNGKFSFTAVVSDAAGQSVSGKLAINITASSTGHFDGPAELPRVYVKSSLADTPSSGTVHAVKSGGNLQAALDTAKCGDTISLEAGATFEGSFSLPAKSCDDNHWIIIRTSAPDSALPPEGTRLTPCYAGVSSLPGRPRLSCASTKNVLAKIVFPGVGSGPIIIADGANHYRLMGLEITRGTPKALVSNLVANENNGTADHVIFDRSWIHGTAQDETTRGILLGGVTYAAVIDSYLSDFHCISGSGGCTDSQAIAGGCGSNPMGPYKIENNFLEGAAETIIFGGGPATVSPTDIEIRRNHMFKPMNWMKGTANFVGGRDNRPFIVKNAFELKNAQRVLLEGNIFDGAWGGFSQNGFAILLTPKNQAASTGNVCPACLVTDVTIRSSLIRHTASGLQIANTKSDNGGSPRDGQRYSIHDVIFADISGTTYHGSGVLAQVSSGPDVPILQNLKIDHITVLGVTTVFVFGNDVKLNGQMHNFTFTNSITNAGVYPFTSAFGKTDCSMKASPAAVLGACFASFDFSHNALIALPKTTPPSVWPDGNFFPENTGTVQLEDDNTNNWNYRLRSTSPYKRAGTDGKDLGASVDDISAAISGVE